MKLTGIISNQIVNKGRQKELDIAKAFLIFSLAVVHTFCECSDPESLYSGLPYFFDSVIGGPWGAPVFIFCMGIGLSYSSHSSAAELAKRGLKLGLMGYILNTCRFLIPSILGYIITGDHAMYMELLPYRFFEDDILQFACLAMLLMAACKHYNLKPLVIWIIGLVLNLISNFISNADYGNPVLNIAIGHITGTEAADGKVFTNFPLIVWFFVYASGYLFSYIIKRISNKKLFYGILIPICVIPIAIIFPYEYKNRINMMGGPGDNVFYHAKTYDILLCLLAIMSMIAVGYFISLILSDKIMDGITRISKNITVVYLIQWVVVWWFADFFLYIFRGSKYMSSIPTLYIGVTISVVSILLAEVWSKHEQKKKESKVKNEH